MKTSIFICLLSVFAPTMFGASETPKRLKSNISDSETYALKGNIRPVVSLGEARDSGAAPGYQMMPRMALHFNMTPSQQAELAQLLQDQQNRRSKQYRKFLTPEEYAARFGLNTADIAKVTQWLESKGFANIETARSRTFISFTGNVAQTEAAFHTAIHTYSLSGETHMANATDPELPKAFEGLVEGIRGLHDFQAKPRLLQGIKPHYVSGGNQYLVPDDWETIYHVKPLYGAGLDGSPISGQTYSIAVVGQSNIQLSDIRAFRAAAGLVAKDPTVLIPSGDSDPGLQTIDQAEADLDLEWAGAIAKNANILFITADTKPDNGWQDAIAYAINHNVAPVLLTSYGQCEKDLSPTEFSMLNTLLGQAVAQSMIVIAAAGDNGAAACDAGTVATSGLSVDFPASSQYVTAIGGTELNPGSSAGSYFGSSNNSAGGTAQSYIPEIAWNDGNAAATGGGFSTLVAKPSWQTGSGVPADGQRDVPDLAFTASIKNYGLLYCYNGSCSSGFSTASSSVTGGTSAAAAAFAGVAALLVQQTVQQTSTRPASPLNSNLYSLAAISANAFHDVTAGTNQVNCQGGSPDCPASSGTGVIGYTAGTGYDQATGLGSIDAFNFVEQWSGDIQLTASPASVNLQPASSATSTITVTPVNHFSGPVTFTCSVASSLANVTCSAPSTTVNTSGSINVTIANNNQARVLLPNKRGPRVPPNLVWAGAGLALCGFLFVAVRPRSKRVVWTWVSAAGCMALTLGAVSCGSSISTTGSLFLSCVLPEAHVSIAYNGGSCTASYGKTPYTYAVTTNSLPSGLTLNSSTGAVTGTPIVSGTSNFNVTVTDGASNTSTKAETLIVQPAPTEYGLVTITATSGSIVNTTTIAVTAVL